MGLETKGQEVFLMQDSPRSRILCVDDCLDTCDLLEAALPRVSFVFAHTFAAACDLARFGRFDFFLLDNRLPDGSGRELCRVIRTTDVNTPIVFLSAAAYRSDHDEAMAAGATAYIDKPVDVVQLERVVMGLIRQSESRSLDAKIAEITAVRDEINKYLAEAGLNENAGTSRRAIDRRLKARAYDAFVDSGGLRSHFEKLWPGISGSFIFNNEVGQAATERS